MIGSITTHPTKRTAYNNRRTLLGTKRINAQAVSIEYEVETISSTEYRLILWQGHKLAYLVDLKQVGSWWKPKNPLMVVGTDGKWGKKKLSPIGHKRFMNARNWAQFLYRTMYHNIPTVRRTYTKV